MAEDIVEEWVKTLDCPIIRVDGAKPVEENINYGRVIDMKMYSLLKEEM